MITRGHFHLPWLFSHIIAGHGRHNKIDLLVESISPCTYIVCAECALYGIKIPEGCNSFIIKFEVIYKCLL